MDAETEADVQAALATKRRVAELEEQLRRARAEHGASLQQMHARQLSLRTIAALVGYRSDMSVRRAMGRASQATAQVSARTETPASDAQAA